MKVNTTPPPKDRQSELERSQPKYQDQPMYEVKFSVLNKQQYEVVPKEPKVLLAAFRSSKEPWRHAVRAVRFAQGQIQLSLSHWQYEGVVRGLEKELSEIYQVQLQAIDEYVFDIPQLDLKPEDKEDLRSLGEQNNVTVVKMEKRGECWWFSVATLKDAVRLQRINKFIVLDREYRATPRVHKAKPIFCFKCSVPGHTMNNCESKKIVCGKCSAEDSHYTKKCTVKSDDFLCPFCKGDRNHFSGSSECRYTASQQEHSKARKTKPCHPWWTNSATIDSIERLISSTASDIAPLTRSGDEHILTMDNVQENNKLDEGRAHIADGGVKKSLNTADNVLKQNDALGTGDGVAGNKRPSNEMVDSSLDHPPKKRKSVGRPRKTVKNDHEKGERVTQSPEGRQNLVTKYMRPRTDIDPFFDGLPYYPHGEGDSEEPETANNRFSSNP